MLAAVLHAPFDLRVERRDDPQPGAGEVLVRVAFGGICGSDLSYFRKGRVGDFAVGEPLTLGHEVAGTVVAVGADVGALAQGTRVAINPSRACRHCEYCLEGRGNLCRNMRFLGSAAITPHVQGAFSETVVVRADQAVPIPDGMSLRIAACAEPLAVALHAARRAGHLLGRRVLIAGAGPIGLLCLLVAHRAGASEICVTDLQDAPLAIARACGATEAVNVAAEPTRMAEYEIGRGHFDVVFEATGSPDALAQIVRVVRAGGRIVQLGMMPPGAIPVPVNMLMAREIDLIGSFRFHGAFAAAVQALGSGRIDVAPILSGVFPLADAVSAFELAGDRSRAIKVHLAIG